jgi:type II secretory pathway pseudopilin PulG
MMKINNKTKGAGLVEVVIGVSLILITLVGLISAYNLFLKTALKNTEILQANFLIEEGLEASRALRDYGWDSNIENLVQGTNYDVIESGGVWQYTSNISLIDGKFYRAITVADVLRDGNDDIASSGTLDSNTKLFTVSISWLEGGATSTRSLSAYLTKLF